MVKTNDLGKIGEEIATKYLTKKGYRILVKNYKVSFGEIDIIAEHRNCICFVEVKLRKNIKYGYPEEAINYFKKRKIIRVAQFYLNQKGIDNKLLRFDVISILCPNGLIEEIKHIINAFSL